MSHNRDDVPSVYVLACTRSHFQSYIFCVSVSFFPRYGSRFHAPNISVVKTGGRASATPWEAHVPSFDGAVGTRPHTVVLMATPRYVLDTTLPTGHSNSITALQFSPDGRFLASGSGDGVLMIFSTSTWKPVKRFVDVSSVTAVVWHPTFQKTLLCGYGSGDVHTMNFESHSLVSAPLHQPHRLRSYQQVDNCHKVWTDRLGGPVHSLALDKTGARAALSYGSDVAVVEQHAICGSKVTSGEGDKLNDCDSCLDKCTESP